MSEEEQVLEAAEEAAEAAEDKRHRDRGMGYVRFLSQACALAFWMVVATCAGLLAPHMPDLEGQVRPVVHGALLEQPPVTRVSRKLCFSMHIWKTNFGLPILYQYYVEVRQSEHFLAPIELNAHLANDDDTLAPDDFDNHKPDTEWDRRWCALLPYSVPGYSVIRVTGYAVHRVHPLWDTHSPMPSFEVRPSE